MERFSVIADKRTDIVKLVLNSSEQKITLIIDNKEVAKGIETHRAKIDGDSSDNLEILFNIKYLTRVIRSIPFDTICLKLGSPTSPVIIEPASPSSLRTEHLLALAPIKL